MGGTHVVVFMVVCVIEAGVQRALFLVGGIGNESGAADGLNEPMFLNSTGRNIS